MLTLQQKQFKLVFRGVAMVVAGVLRTSPANAKRPTSDCETRIHQNDP